MEDYLGFGDGDCDESILGALRSIGGGGAHGATINPLANTRSLGDETARAETARGESAFGEDNYDIIQQARKSETQRLYDRLRQQHQVDLNDAKQLADLEDPGLLAHMDRARKQMSDHARGLAALPAEETLQAHDTAARRSLSGLMTSLKAQQMAIRVACDDVLLQATNSQKLAEGGRPHGHPPGGTAAKSFEIIGEKVSAAGEDLARVAAALGEFERELTLARRAYENAVEGLSRRGQYFERAYGEVACLAGHCHAAPTI
jgi:hypothetical protein